MEGKCREVPGVEVNRFPPQEEGKDLSVGFVSEHVVVVLDSTND